MIKTKIVEVTSAATALLGEPDRDKYIGRSVAVRNLGTVDLFIGGEDVSVADGWKIMPGSHMTFDLKESDHLYGCTQTDPVDVSILQAGV